MRFVRYIVLVLVCTLWLGGCFEPINQLLHRSHLIADPFRYGDLYRLANLPQFREPKNACQYSVGQPDTTTDSIHLYLIGDSFTEGQFLKQSDLPVQKLNWYHWYYNRDQAMQIDTTARNVLLLETVERHLRERAALPLSNPILTSSPQAISNDNQQQMSWLANFATQLKTALFMQYNISERLEIVLFSHDFFLWFCELKASLNMRFFNRVAPTVALSKNKQHLFVGSDVDETIPLTYPFSPLTDAEVNRLVEQLNATAARFQKAGFDKVILSVIPNKITLLEPDRGAYNHLVERVQQHPLLQLTIVDLYTPYSRMHAAPYAVGDAHWNCQGRQIWLDAVAKAIQKNKGQQ